MKLEYEFEKTPWEQALEGLAPGGSITASKLLAVVQNEDDETLAEAIEQLCANEITLCITDLPKYTTDSQIGTRLAMEEKLVGTDGWISKLEENDPLRLYLDEISQIPAYGDPNQMAQVLASGDSNVTEELVNLMLYRVVEAAPRFVGMGVLLVDLIQEGSLGLWQGLQQYKSGNIEDYCDWWIYQYMSGAVVMQAKAAGIGEKMHHAMEDYRDVDQKLLAELGRNPSVEEIAEAMHMTPQQVLAVAETLENAQMLQRAKAPEEEQNSPQEENVSVEDTAYFQMRQRIEELLSALSEDDAKLLSLRYGLEGSVPMKPQQVALKLGITPEEVAAREAAALSKLRQENQ